MLSPEVTEILSFKLLLYDLCKATCLQEDLHIKEEKVRLQNWILFFFLDTLNYNTVSKIRLCVKVHVTQKAAK